MNPFLTDAAAQQLRKRIRECRARADWQAWWAGWHRRRNQWAENRRTTVEHHRFALQEARLALREWHALGGFIP